MLIIPFSLHASAKDITIPFDLSTGRPVIEVMLNGKGPYKFIFDTGASGSVIDAGISKELNLNVIGKVKVGSPAGHEVLEGEVVKAQLGAGGITLDSMQAASIEIKKFAGSDGILSFKAFAGYLMIIDYPASKIRLTEGELTASSSTSYTLDMLMIIPGIAGGVNLNFVIDSGAMGSIAFPKEYMDKLKLKYEPEPAGVIRTVGGESKKWKSQLDGSITVAGITLENPEIFFAEHFKHVNLGFEVLKNMAITVDQKNSLLKLEKKGNTEITPEEENEYTGRYEIRTITSKGGILYIQRDGGQKLSLEKSPEADSFTVPAIPSAKLKFVRDASGKITELHVFTAEGKWEVSKKE